MNVLPNIPGHTVANWPLQGNLLDVSGNGLDLEALYISNLATGAPTNFTAFADGVVGLDLGGTFPAVTQLRAAFSPSFHLTGQRTFQWLMSQNFTFVNTYFTCCDPTPPGRDVGFGNGAPDIKGSLYTLYWASVGRPGLSDQFYGGGGGVTVGFDFAGAGVGVWTDLGIPFLAPRWHAYAMVLDATGLWSCYRDGVKIGPGVQQISTNVAVGNERFFLGGTEVANNGGAAWWASFRVLDVALPPADVLRDSTFMLGTPSDPSYAVNFDPDERRDPIILRGKSGLSMQTGFKERMPENSATIAAFRNITAAAQAGNIFRQKPRMFPMPDDGRST